jgi:hypothetical protein
MILWRRPTEDAADVDEREPTPISVLQRGVGRDKEGPPFRCSDGFLMPHKANAARRHHIPRPKRRVTNSAEYDAALRRRGSLTVWFTDAAVAAWRAAREQNKLGGRPQAAA